MKLILCCAAVTLQGCSALSAITALLPTPVGCAPKDSPSPPPVTQNQELAKLDDYQMILVIGAERNDLIVYAKQADAIIQACR